MAGKVGFRVTVVLVLAAGVACAERPFSGLAPGAAGVASALSFGAVKVTGAQGIGGCQVAFCVEGSGCHLCSTGEASTSLGCVPFSGCGGAPADGSLGAGQTCSVDGCLPSGCFPAYCNAYTGDCVVCDDGDPATADECVEDPNNPCRYVPGPGSEAVPEASQDVPMVEVPASVPEVPAPACKPDCAGKECGDDGCGGQCGTGCPALTQSDCFHRECQGFKCIGVMEPCDDGNDLTTDWCTMKDGCRHKVNDGCQPSCVQLASCFLDATGTHCGLKECGTDGCGGDCGACAPPIRLCLTASCDAFSATCRTDARDCDDGNPATLDFCAPMQGCWHTFVPIIPTPTPTPPDAGPPEAPDAAVTPDDGSAPDPATTPDVPVAGDVPVAIDVPVATDVPTPKDGGCNQDSWGEKPCQPNCWGKACGSDGCGGTCGECPDDSPFGKCAPYACVWGQCKAKPVVCPSNESCDPGTGDCKACSPQPTPECLKACEDKGALCTKSCKRCEESCPTKCADQVEVCKKECPPQSCGTAPSSSPTGGCGGGTKDHWNGFGW